MSFIGKDDFFFAKISIFCKWIAGPLPILVQAYTQPYSFGGRIKLIICQIRPVTIHKISTSWKKTLDGGLFRNGTHHRQQISPSINNNMNSSIIAALFSIDIANCLKCYHFALNFPFVLLPLIYCIE